MLSALERREEYFPRRKALMVCVSRGDFFPLAVPPGRSENLLKEVYQMCLRSFRFYTTEFLPWQ